MALKYEQLVKAQILSDGVNRSISDALSAAEGVYRIESADQPLTVYDEMIPGVRTVSEAVVERLHVYAERDSEEIYSRQNIELRQALVEECLERLYEKFDFFSKTHETPHCSGVSIIVWDVRASEWMAEDTMLWTLKLNLNALFIPYVDHP